MAAVSVRRCSDSSRQPNWSSSGVTVRDRLACDWASYRLGSTRSHYDLGRCMTRWMTRNRTVRKHGSSGSKAEAWWIDDIAARCSRRSRWFEMPDAVAPPAGTDCAAVRWPCGCASTANRPFPCRAHTATCRCWPERLVSCATAGYGPCRERFKVESRRVNISFAN